MQTQNVFDEDLQKKIEENERLHIQVRVSSLVSEPKKLGSQCM